MLFYLLAYSIAFTEAEVRPALWKKSQKTIMQAGQEFSPDGRTVINRGDVFGDQLMVSAQGTYELQVIQTDTVQSQTLATTAWQRSPQTNLS